MTTAPQEIPTEFKKVMMDFVQDVQTTFPEYSPIIARWWDPTSDEKWAALLAHCRKVYPERFFDIMYENADMFAATSAVVTEFLPGILFKHLWAYDDITDETRKTLWKYLQLTLIAIIGGTDNQGIDFGQTAQMFEALNETELQDKLKEMFDNMTETDAESFQDKGTTADTIKAKLTSMLDGKLGRLAKEFAEETAKDLDIDLEATDGKMEIFKKLFQSGKLMPTMQKLHTKMQEKIKAGEISEREMYEEGLEMFQQMKDLPGMGGLGKIIDRAMGGRVNKGAMEAQLKQQARMAKMKERMQKRLAKRQEAAGVPVAPVAVPTPVVEVPVADVSSSSTAGTSEKKKKRRGKR